jgi:predicted ATPase
VNALEPAQAARVVTSLAGGRALPAGTVEQIVRKTDGVPLFIEEVARTVLQHLAVGDGASAPRSPPAVPETLQDTLMARVDQAAPVKDIAQVAAAIGREFALDLLEAAAPFSREEVRRAIGRLVETGLLSEQKGRAAETYAFKHALVQDALYASMLRDRRRELHLRIAQALCRNFADMAETAPELVAHHFTQAQEMRLAISYWSKAGRQAGSRSAFVEAGTHFQSALTLLAQLPESAERDAAELQLQQALASTLIATKGFGAEETTQAFKRALQLCEKGPDGPHTLAVLNGLVGVYYMRGDFEQSRGTAEDLLARAERQGDATGLLMGHRVLGMSLFARGELAEARRHLEAAIALYDAPVHAPLALIYSHDFKATAEVYLGLVLALQGDVERGIAHGRAALAYAEELRQPHTICYVLPFLAGTLVVSGSPSAALPIAERTIALSAEYGFPQWVAGGLLLRGWARLELGQAESGIADIRSSISGLEASGTLVWMQFARFLLALGLAKSGETGAALELVERILVEIGAAGGRWYEAEAQRLRGELLLAAGRPRAEAEACFASAGAVTARQGSRLWRHAEGARSARPDADAAPPAARPA